MTDIDIEKVAAAADLAKVLGHMHRIALLEHIAQGERSVDRLAHLSGLSMANASQHLQHLKRAGFVLSRRDGKRVIYRLGEGPVLDVLAALQTFVDHNRAEIRALISDHAVRSGNLEAITREELLDRIAEGSVTVLDVRPEEEFDLGHLPGAINIPFNELEARLADIPAGNEIVAYCRGPNCLFSIDALKLLRDRGLTARHLENGFPAWKVAKLPVEACA
ncbi:MAG: metalloregulator ArsR/SmtB family transcription factor [Rhodobiaceae bacterium]|nr:biofilm growth-associated repressor [Rhodobiaceae bacterium]MCR9243007.1 metalloregulator ArsR/SmtB family transcription factor [Rhodobiaceae bacterium]